MNDIEARNRALIADYIAAGAVPKGTGKLGIELEHIIVNADDLSAVSYSQDGGVESILDALSDAYDSEILEGADLIGLAREDSTVTIEPASQLEISVAPCPTLACIEKAYRRFRTQLDPVLEARGLIAVAQGYHPTARARDLELIPKERYRLMDAHFATTGRHGICMMRGSASTQVSIDYRDEDDAIRKFKIANLLGPLFSFITDNAPVFEGDRRSGRMARTRIWNDVDAERSMVVPGLFREGYDTPYTFLDYADYIMSAKPVLIMRDGHATSTGNLTADEVYAGHVLSTDEAVHLLSMFFPDVRLKRYMEIRMADSMPIDFGIAYAALIKGLFYRQTNLAAIEEMLAAGDPLDDTSIPHAKSALMSDAWMADVYGTPAWKWLDELVALAWKGLSSDERDRLAPLARLIERRQTLFDIAHDSDDIASDVAPDAVAVTAEYRATVDALSGDKPGRFAAHTYMQQSSAVYHGDIIDSGYIPTLITPELRHGFEHVSARMHGILGKMIARCQADPAYRALFGFDALTEELICLPAAYDDLLPICRLDIFLDKTAPLSPDGDLSFRFCEVNTDGTSAMNEDREAANALMDTPTFRQMQSRYDLAPQSTFDPLVRLVERTYRQWCQNHDVAPKDHPRIAIVDFPASATGFEFKEFKKRFARHGMRASICDIHSLKFRSGHLMAPNGHAVDCVYRRAVTSEVVADAAGAHDLIDAARADALPIVGAFRTQVPHCKRSFEMLNRPETLAFLDADERRFVEAHVPFTATLKPELLAAHPDILSAHDRWILKPNDGYACSDIFAGPELDASTWQSAIREHCDGSFVIQEYCAQQSEPNLHVKRPDASTWEDENELIGLWTYGGHFLGAYTRANAAAVIGGPWSEDTLPGFYVEPKRS